MISRPSDRLADVLRSPALRSELSAFLRAVESKELDALTKVPTDGDFRRVQGRVQMLRDLVTALNLEPTKTGG